MEKTADIFVLIGQSNADGRGPMTDLPADLAAFYAAPRPPLHIYYKEAVRHGCTLDPRHFNTPGAWWQLGPGHDATRRVTHQVTGDGGSSVARQSAQWHGCELAYAAAHAQARPGTPLWIVKAAVGGAAIENDWGVTNAGPDSLWVWFRDHVYGPARADLLARGTTPCLRKVFWMQGESDANPDDAPLYESRLRALLHRLDTELGDRPEAIVIGGLSATYNTASGAIVKAAQAAVAQSHPRAVLLPTDGSDGTPALPLRPDNIHYTAAGLRILGQRVHDACP